MYGKDTYRVDTEDYLEVVEWFNLYEPERVEKVEIPVPADAQIVVDTNDRTTTIINYKDGNIYVSKSGETVWEEYIFLDESPKLENFFEELVVK